VTTVLTVGAAFVVSWRVASAMLVAAPVLWLSTRWYLRRAPAGYLAERSTWATMTAGIAETAEGARSVEALGRQDGAAPARLRRHRGGLPRRALHALAADDVVPVRRPVVRAAAGVGVCSAASLYTRGPGLARRGDTVALYVQLLLDPLDRLLSWLDELQVARVLAGARLIGWPRCRTTARRAARRPQARTCTATTCRFAYRDGARRAARPRPRGPAG
jgi:ABC-type multidrug transport system fused ATPase/permease subunit